MTTAVRMFPIMGGKRGPQSPIPWDFIAPHETQAMENHSQTLERLAQRGGLDPGEALAIVLGQTLNDGLLPFDESNRQLRALVAEWEARR